MRTVDPKRLKSLDELVLLTSKGRGWTRDELMERMYPEWPGCGHDHEHDLLTGLGTTIREGSMRSYELHGEMYYCLTYLGHIAMTARESVN